VEDVKNAYLFAWNTNCKGITVFRDGSKSEQVLNLGVKKEEKEQESENKEVPDVTPIQIRPFRVIGATYKLDTPVGTAFITINEDGTGEPLEVFINVGKAGSDVTAMAEALGRTISTALRFRGQLNPSSRAEEIAEQLAGIGGRRSVGFGPNKILSLPDAIAAALSTHFGFKINGYLKEKSNGEYVHAQKHNGEISRKEVGAKPDAAEAVLMARVPAQQEDRPSRTDDPTTALAESGLSSATSGAQQLSLSTNTIGDICPSCGAGAFVYQEGCAKCHSCGYSEC
jgi:ribonucleoside-diphosphate reductase alpha chain